MFTSTLLLLFGYLFSNPVASVVHVPGVATVPETPLGGPRSIRIAGLPSGDLSAKQFASAKAVELAGGAADEKVVSLTISAADANVKILRGYGPEIDASMRSMITGLEVGSSFYVEVNVKDGSGKVWTVPAAQFTWKG